MKTITKTTMSLAAAMGTLALAATSVNAATVVTPIGVSSNSSQANASYTPDRMIDSSGLTAAGDVSTWTHAISGAGNYFNSGATTDSNEKVWLTSSYTTPLDIIFTVPTDSTVGAIHTWPAAGTTEWNTNNNMESADLSFSFDGGSTFTTTITVGDFARDFTSSKTTQTIEFAQQTGVDAIKLTNIYRFGGSIGSPGMNIAEIRFSEETSVIPEPSTTALLGLGGLALIFRRRK